MAQARKAHRHRTPGIGTQAPLQYREQQKLGSVTRPSTAIAGARARSSDDRVSTGSLRQRRHGDIDQPAGARPAAGAGSVAVAAASSAASAPKTSAAHQFRCCPRDRGPCRPASPRAPRTCAPHASRGRARGTRPSARLAASSSASPVARPDARAISAATFHEPRLRPAAIQAAPAVRSGKRPFGRLCTAARLLTCTYWIARRRVGSLRRFENAEARRPATAVLGRGSRADGPA